MAHVLTAVVAETADLSPVRTALLSVSDKTGLVEFASSLAARGVALLSTGGTAKALRDAGLVVTDVSEHTGFPEIMDGRVKTLHPRIHGGLLGVRGSAAHAADMAAHGITPIDLVVVNLYAFGATVAKGADFATCIENIDIGGPSMLRSSAKNNAAVAVASSPSQYSAILAVLAANAGATTLALRRELAAAAFAHTAAYDAAIASWFATQVPAASSAVTTAAVTQRRYVRDLPLKYGCNPHQAPAWMGHVEEEGSAAGVGATGPLTVLHGTPGYINLLDAANAWQLVLELKAATGLPAAASFKHVSPAGAAVAVPLSPEAIAMYEVSGPLTPTAVAYVRARNADPMCSYGDFAAVSEVVDEATASFLKTEVSDGIVAPGYEPAALAILKAKKNGSFIVLQGNVGYTPPTMEYREVGGMVMAQRRNDALISPASSLDKIVTAPGVGALSEEAKRDLAVALITIKYTQSNSVGYAREGQMVGVGAGQQSRVDCVKLAGRKVATWWLRSHPKVAGLAFKDEVKRTARVNARVRYIEGDMSPIEYSEWVTNFIVEPPALTEADKSEWLKGLKGVALASDAFFPFRDSIDHAAKYGVAYAAQPGGSVQDAEVTKAAESYGIVMAHGLPRLFHH